jgi:hypothetical protein
MAIERATGSESFFRASGCRSLARHLHLVGKEIVAISSRREDMDDGPDFFGIVRYTSVREVLRCLPISKAECSRSHARGHKANKSRQRCATCDLARDTERFKHAGNAEYPDWMTEEGHGEKGRGCTI